MNKNLLFSLIILFISIQIQAQDSDKWSLRIFTGTNHAIVQSYYYPTSSILAPQLGGAVAYKIGERWDLSAGLRVAQRGYRYHGTAPWSKEAKLNNFYIHQEKVSADRIAGFVVNDPLHGNPYPTIPSGAEFAGYQMRYTMLEIPISARFYLVKSKFQVFLSPGWTYYLPVSLNGTTRYILQDGTSEEIKNSSSFPALRRIPLIVNVSAGARFPVSDRIHIYAQSGIDGYFHHFRDQVAAEGWNWDVNSVVGIEIGL
ncbi:MAG: outer membrane beta-barrel protein [Bacteroidetes bacterium]|nr:outer membrane beta-barrel protein [Bacteroidota bacterium]